MKKIKLIALAILSGLAFSCSSDDGPSTSGEFTGKWYFKETRVEGETIPYDDHEVCGKDYIQFNADGTGKSVDVYNCEEFDEIFTYTRNGNNVTMIFGGESSTVQIIELSSTTLKVKSTYDYDGDGDEEQVIEVVTRT